MLALLIDAWFIGGCIFTSIGILLSRPQEISRANAVLMVLAYLAWPISIAAVLLWVELEKRARITARARATKSGAL